jgi:hypothetical protein
MDRPEKMTINNISLLKENITKGNARANIKINSTLPAFPMKEAVRATLRLKAIM